MTVVDDMAGSIELENAAFGRRLAERDAELAEALDKTVNLAKASERSAHAGISIRASASTDRRRGACRHNAHERGRTFPDARSPGWFQSLAGASRAKLYPMDGR